MDVAHKLRLILLCFASTAVLFPCWYQPNLDALWAWLRGARFYQTSTFETFWTVFWYAVIEVSITVVFMKNVSWRFAHHGMDDGESNHKPKGMRRPNRRWIEGFTYILPLLTLDLTMIKKFADVPLEEMLRSGNYDPSALQAGHSQHFLLPSLHNFTSSSPLQTQRALPLAAPSARRLVVELITSLVLYDFLFFLFHLSMHILPGFKQWHRPHHSHAEIHPQVTNQLHLFERLGLVLLANFSLNIIKSHVLTRTLFVPLFVWLLVEIHSGMDLPWAYDKVLPHGWAGGARKHARHHRLGESGFAPFFEWCDVLWDNLKTRLRSVRITPD